MQIIVATLPLQQLTFSLESEKQSPGTTSSEMSSTQESEVCEVESDQYCMPQDTTAAEARRKSEESLTQNVTNYISEQQLGDCLKIQHQKQTSSQLVHFLRTSRNMEQSSFAGFEEGAFVLTQQLKSRTVTNRDPESIQLPSIHEKPIVSETDYPVPVFKVKNISAESVTYRCMIFTNSELWDIGDISTEVKNSLQVSVADERLSFADHDDSRILDPFTPSFCISCNESMTSEQMKHQCGMEAVINRSMDGQEAAVRIPEFKIKKFEEMPVVVTHVVSPGNFCIQHKENNLQELSDIMA